MGGMMRSRLTFLVTSVCLLTILAAPQPRLAAASEHRFIVRTSSLLDPTGVVRTACAIAGCEVQYGLGDPLGQLFLVTAPILDPDAYVLLLESLLGISHAEVDRVGRTRQTSGDVPPALAARGTIDFFGVQARAGFVQQPAVEILGIDTARQRFGLTGRGVTVAIIDTGVDPNHPLLKRVLLTGYDFTRGRDGGSELSDVDQSTMAVLDDGKPGWVNQSTMAVLDQSTMAVLDGPEYAAFGHGTMVAGAIHRVAPRARLLPLKAFGADGSGYTSDVLRASYYAVRKGAKVISMSFSFAAASPELQRAVEYATARGVVAVASAGNDGEEKLVYPAAFKTVIGVASSADSDTLSRFSNYGQSLAWIAAPGEAIVTTYPFGSYAAAWGTSFSTPFAAGTAALLAEVSSRLNAAEAAAATGNAVWISPDVARGRLDITAAISAWRARLGLW